MLASVEGVYRDGRIELTEIPTSISEDTVVIVTFLTSGFVDLREQGIDESLAAELRAGFATFAEDWDAPQMEIYDRWEIVSSNSSSSQKRNWDDNNSASQS